MKLELTVDRVAIGGDGIAREPDGRVVFVTGALPGERVRVEVTARARDFWRASVTEVLVAAPARRNEPCPWVRAGCGGCDWQHVDPAAQLTLKVDMARDALIRQGRLAAPFLVAGARLEDAGYRTTVRLGVAGDGSVGFRRVRSHDLVSIDDCLVAHPAIASLIPSLRVAGATEIVLRVSEATGEITVLPIGEAERGGRLNTARIDGLGPTVQVGDGAVLYEVVAGRRLRVSAASFFQSSARSAEILVDAVRRSAGEPAPSAWADLYGGVGVFAATLWPEAPVTLVEMSPSSCADARVNLQARPASVVELDVEHWRPQEVDVVVADPARSGLGRAGADAVAATGAGRVVLVSCDLAALGRDTRLLVERGYRHLRSEVVDLFPNTAHAEVVTAFGRSDA